MSPILREKIKNSGYRSSFLAQKIGMSDQYFSMCLKGIRNMPQDKQNMLKTILK